MHIIGNTLGPKSELSSFVIADCMMALMMHKVQSTSYMMVYALMPWDMSANVSQFLRNREVLILWGSLRVCVCVTDKAH